MTGSTRVAVDVTNEAVALPWIRPRSTGTLIAHWLFIAVGFALVVGAVGGGEPTDRFVGVLLGIAIITLVGFSLVGQRRVPGLVRVRSLDDGIVFAPGVAVPVILLVVATGILILSVVALASPGVGGGPVGRYGGFGALALAGGWGIVDAVSRLRDPRGVKISAQGVSWRRTLRRTDLEWDDIGDVGLVAQRTQLCLVVCSTEGQCTTIYPLTTGSDAYVIAQVLEHYRSRPEARRGPITVEAVGKARPA